MKIYGVLNIAENYYAGFFVSEELAKKAIKKGELVDFNSWSVPSDYTIDEIEVKEKLK